jgi:hypothetical protein
MGSPVLRIEVLQTSLKMELSMSETNTVSPLRQRMIEDMAARKLNPHTQRGHIHSCKRFAAWLKRSPDTATADEVRRFQLHLIENGASICNRNRIMTGVRLACTPVIERTRSRRVRDAVVSDALEAGTGPVSSAASLAPDRPLRKSTPAGHASIDARWGSMTVPSGGSAATNSAARVRSQASEIRPCTDAYRQRLLRVCNKY